MVLPLLGSFLAQSILPGMVASGSVLANPLVAGAIGSGIGSLLQGDSLEDAIGTGFTSFLGGKLLGSLGAAGKGAQAAPTEVLGQAMQMKDATTGMFGTPAMNVATPTNVMQGGLNSLQNALKQGAANVVANPMVAAGSALGTTIGQQIANPPDTAMPQSDYRRTESTAPNRQISFPVAGYDPGVDPEYVYGFQNPSASQITTSVIKEGGLARYAKPSMMGMSAELSGGGLVALAEGGQPRNRFEQMMA